MKNTYELVWTNEALKGLESILDYLQNNFPIQVTRKFVTQLDKQLKMILQNPALFPASEIYNEVRRMIVHRLTTVYYVVRDQQIILITIIDNRMDLHVLE